jgi:hypothetical protein
VRLAGVTAREVELARRAAALALRERELDARPEPVPEPEPEPEPDPEPAAAPAPPPAAVGPGRNGFYNLTTLEHLVGTRGSAFPDRLEEWSSYLYFLRDYADADGFVPASFDALIAETFAELV